MRPDGTPYGTRSHGVRPLPLGPAARAERGLRPLTHASAPVPHPGFNVETRLEGLAWTRWAARSERYAQARRGVPYQRSRRSSRQDQPCDSDGGVKPMSAREPNAEPLPGDPGLPRAQRLAGKVAIVTGAGSRPAGPDGPVVGNGRATAITLAREGARVVLVDEDRKR